MYLMSKGNLWGVADADKNILVPCEYDLINTDDNHIYIRKGCYVGMLDDMCRTIISTDEKYVSIKKVPLSVPCIIASAAFGKNALYDMKGKKLSDAIYDNCIFHVFSNKDTVMMVNEGKLWGINSIKGERIIPLRYEDLNFLETPVGNYFYVFKDKLVGLCDYEGHEIIDTQYTDIKFKRAKDKDYFLARNGEFVGVFNVDGTQLINGETFNSIFYNEAKSQFIATVDKRKCIFTKEGALLADNCLDIQRDRYITIADDCFERGKYKDAAKNYALAINIRPTASLYFNRAVSYYNASKYNDAISDFYSCLKNRPSERLRIRSLELIDKAEAYQAEKEQRLNSTISAIFGLALTGANIYFESQAAKQRNKYSATQSSRTHVGSSNDNYNTGHTSVSSSGKTDCPSLKVARGKWYCVNTGRCGMCGGDGLMDGQTGVNNLMCTLCGGTGKCKYCQ